MSCKRLLASVLGICFFLPSLLFAHHSFTAQFEGRKLIKLSGVITKVDWINPHVYVYIDVKDNAGKITNWSIESYPTAMLRRSGVTRSMFVEGQNVTVTVNPAKDTTPHLGFLRNIVFPNGNELNFRDNDIEPPPAGANK